MTTNDASFVIENIVTRTSRILNGKMYTVEYWLRLDQRKLHIEIADRRIDNSIQKILYSKYPAEITIVGILNDTEQWRFAVNTGKRRMGWKKYKDKRELDTTSTPAIAYIFFEKITIETLDNKTFIEYFDSMSNFLVKKINARTTTLTRSYRDIKKKYSCTSITSFVLYNHTTFRNKNDFHVISADSERIPNGRNRVIKPVLRIPMVSVSIDHTNMNMSDPASDVMINYITILKNRMSYIFSLREELFDVYLQKIKQLIDISYEFGYSSYRSETFCSSMKYFGDGRYNSTFEMITNI